MVFDNFFILAFVQPKIYGGIIGLEISEIALNNLRKIAEKFNSVDFEQNSLLRNYFDKLVKSQLSNPYLDNNVDTSSDFYTHITISKSGINVILLPCISARRNKNIENSKVYYILSPLLFLLTLKNHQKKAFRGSRSTRSVVGKVGTSFRERNF